MKTHPFESIGLDEFKARWEDETLGRLLSLDVSGSILAPTFTGVFDTAKVTTIGSGQTHEPALPASAYNKRNGDYRKLGYRPELLAASGNGATAIVSATWVRDGIPAYAEADLDAATFEAYCERAQHPGNDGIPGLLPIDDRLVLTSAAVYGSTSQPRYAGVWVRNDSGARFDFACCPVAELKDHLAAHDGQWGRVQVLSVSEGGQCVAVWCDDDAGPTTRVVDATLAAYQKAANTAALTGAAATLLTSRGSGTKARYSAVFATRLRPRARTFRPPTGDPVPGVTTAMDELMEPFMDKHAIRGATVAVAKDGRLIAARGYTRAEPDYEPVLPTSRFRIASLSKTYTAAAIHAVAAAGGHDLGDTVQGILQLKTPSGDAPDDPNWNAMTVDQLLLHHGGLRLQGASVADLGPPFPVNDPAQGVLEHMAGDAADLFVFAPGTKVGSRRRVSYSNCGYRLLGAVVQAWAGQPYLDVVPQLVQPPGLDEPVILPASPTFAQRADGEVRYHAYGSGFRTVAPSELSAARPLAPRPYAFDTRAAVASGYLVTTSVAHARFLQSLFAGLGPVPAAALPHAIEPVPTVTNDGDEKWGARIGMGVWKILGDGTVIYAKSGDLDGAHSRAIHYDGLTAVILTNGNRVPSEGQMHGMLKAITAAGGWPGPSHDLWSTVGLPPLS